MDLFFGLSVGYLVYLAFVFDTFGFLARDELWLRLLMLAASALYLIYYYVVADEPLWDAIITNGALGAVNLAMIVVVIIERTTFSMTKETAALYQSFGMLTPGQFRRLLKKAEEVVAVEDMVIVQKGAPVKRLFFVTNGPVRVARTDAFTDIGSNVFIGEVAYLRDRLATATVSVGSGACYLAWDHDELRKMTKSSPALKVAMTAQFNIDLIDKLIRSEPEPQAL